MINFKWDITYICNLNCAHCINGQFLNKIENELTTEEVKTVIDKMSELNTRYVHLLGGEPTARKDFVEIMNYFEEKGISVGFNTNGLLLKKEELRNLLGNKTLKSIVVSLEGPTAEINDSIRGKNVFKPVVANLKELVKLKKEKNYDQCSLSINTVVSKANFQYINDMIDFCLEVGIDEFNILEYIAEGNAKDENVLSFNEHLKLVELLSRRYAGVKDRLKIKPRFTRPLAVDYAREYFGLEFPMIPHGCGAGSNFACINNKGELFPCDRLSKIVYAEETPESINLARNPFYDIWSKDIFAKPYAMTEGSEIYEKYVPCNECKYLQKECYPCPVYGMELETDLKLFPCVQFLELLNKKRGEASA